MSRVRSTKTDVELLLAQSLWRRGLRYRRTGASLPGKPDLVFPSRRVAVFVDGDFWHGYDWPSAAKKLKTNREYWIGHIERNVQRDHEVEQELAARGWLVIRIWGHAVTRCVETVADEVADVLQSKENDPALAGKVVRIG